VSKSSAASASANPGAGPASASANSGARPASAYAEALLAALPASGAAPPAPRREPAAFAWARSGAMAVTGRADGPPRLAPGPLALCAAAAVDALRALAPGSPLAAGAGSATRGPLDGAALLGERAAHLHLARRGAVSPGGSARLVRTADGWLAVSLPREDDVALLPAWLDADADPSRDPWSFVAERVEPGRIAPLLERARLLGLAVAEAGARAARPPAWLRVGARGVETVPGTFSTPRAPLVLDLSSLWAGPLCGRLLALAGARVVKVESAARPDGARRGSPAFYAALNAGKPSVALDLSTPGGVDALRRLIARADAVIESSRPRALAQLGVDAAALVAARSDLVWVSITAYGRGDPAGGWIGFGDDAGAAAGLAAETGDPDAPLFCGDAIADPLTGVHAAVAALAHLRAGRGALLELALRDVTAHVLASGAPREAAVVEGGGDAYAVALGEERTPVAPPHLALAGGEARPLGADTASILAEC
jgi:crotonobetainyl-CoA:carnitine CoA-transferase CaiB-like acyl-CoA transferase